MCKECGCGLPGETPARISAHHHEHEHEHEHGHGHSHSHEHEHGHTHSHEHGHDHVHEHTHEHEHAHSHDHGDGEHHHHHHHHDDSAMSEEGRRTLEVRRSILEKNDRLAERNRGFFEARGVLVLNVLSSPGSGKTTFISETVRALQNRLKTAVIVGDLATDNDAQR